MIVLGAYWNGMILVENTSILSFGLQFLQNHTKVRTRNGAIQNGRELALTFSRADRGEPFSTVAARLGRARLWVEMIAVCCVWNTVGGLVLLLTFRPNY